MEDPEARILIVGPSRRLVHERLLSGPAGLLSLAPPWFCPKYWRSKRTLDFPNGARVTLASPHSWDRECVRGSSASLVWMDAPEEWYRPLEAYETFCGLARHRTARMRQLGIPARCIITARASPTAFLKHVIDSAPGLVRGRLSTFDNAEHVDPRFIEMGHRLRGTIQGRRDYLGELFFSPEDLASGVSR